MKNTIYFIIFLIFISGMWFLNGYLIFRTTDKEIMKIYESGYSNGYQIAKNQKIIWESPNKIHVYHGNYDTLRIMDSLRVSKILFHKN